MCVGEEIWHLLEIALSQSIRDRPQGIHNPPSHFIDEDTKVQAEKVLNKCRDSSCSKIGQLNIVKISLLPKFVSKFNTISTKIPGVVFSIQTKLF